MSYWHIRKNKKLELHMQWSTNWIQRSIFSKHSTHFYAALLAAVAYISKPELEYFKIVDDVDFSELKWNRSFRSKATSAKSFLMLLGYCKKIIQSQHITVRRAVTTNVCGGKSSSELFPWPPLTPKQRIAVRVKCDSSLPHALFFQKRAALPLLRFLT